MRTFIAVAAFAAISNAIQLDSAPTAASGTATSGGVHAGGNGGFFPGTPTAPPATGSTHLQKFEGAIASMTNWNAYKSANKVNTDKAAAFRKKRAEEVAEYFKDVDSAKVAHTKADAAYKDAMIKTSQYNETKTVAAKKDVASKAATKAAKIAQTNLDHALAEEKKVNDINDALVKSAQKKQSDEKTKHAQLVDAAKKGKVLADQAQTKAEADLKTANDKATLYKKAMDTAKSASDAAKKASADAVTAMNKSKDAALAAHNAFVQHSEASYHAGNF